MKKTFISTKLILIVPILFIIVFLSKIIINYYESQNHMYDFVKKQAQTLDSFMLVHRNYYQNLYLNKIIPLNEETLKGLPAFSAFKISKEFSEQNLFDISVQIVSSDARNNKNKANKEELKAINFFNKNKNKKEYFSNEENYFQYATPLFIKPKCLQCHGQKEDAPKFISKKYNNAYDYKIGELRGIISIKIPKKELKEYFNFSFLKNLLFDIFIVLIIVFISLYLIRYFKNLSNKLKKEIGEKTIELEKSIASLSSHQLAMDESSIVTKSDLNGNITYVNDNFLRITGYTRDDVLGKPHSIIRHPDNPKEMFKKLWDTVKDKKVWKGIVKNKGKYKDYWVDISILPILDENDEIIEYIAVRHDITKMVEQQQKLDNAANTDTLTGFGNRYKLNHDINNSINPALSILNIDNFSHINDFYGHKQGDKVIKKLGSIINDFIKNDNCELYHLQGDEFVIFDKDISKQSFLSKIENLQKKVSNTPIDIEDEQININLSCAISFEEKQNLLTTADMALKTAKKENKDIVVYNEHISLNEEYQNNLKWTKKIKKAIENDQIVPVFQAIINNKDQSWEKYESLVRIQDDDGKLITPYFFLDISKKTKHYNQITKTMINKSFEVFKGLDKEFSINLTIEDILNNEIRKYIYLMLDSYNIGSKVVFEIVESEAIENFESISSFINNVKSYGCKIAIDDFGTGYSNFEYLMKVEADYIKIDGSLIKDITTDENAQIVVSIIVDFAKKMGMKTIAEFVENKQIKDKIIELGIDYSQGYYYSKPELNIDITK